MERQTPAREKLCVSPALAAAQEKLEGLRLAHRRNQIERQADREVQAGRSSPPPSSEVHQTRPNVLPTHLGWHSAPAGRAYHQALQNQASSRSQDVVTIPARPVSPAPPQPAEPEPFLIVPPDVAMAILRKKAAAAGRIWLLLRHLDQDGRGWLAADAAREWLTGKRPATAVCGERQLRKLLAAGDGLFWERDGERIWLRSMARVAAGLGLERLYGRPVRLSLSILWEPIGTVRAHLYAAFHSSRETAGDGGGKPISRESLKALSSATRRTQRLYERRAGVERQANFAVGRVYSNEEAQEQAWEHGRAVFPFQDKRGMVGKAGQIYLARQLPNSYDGPHDILSRSYQRQINRRLTVLLNEGITGNGNDSSDLAGGGGNGGWKRPVFYREGSKAARDFNRSPEEERFWRSRIGCRRFAIWHTLSGSPRERGRP